MEFHGREPERDILNNVYKQIVKSSQMVVITGRRRIGKTSLALKFIENKLHLYLFVAKKSEHLLCQEFLQEIRATFNQEVPGEFNTFKDIFQLLLTIAKETPFVLVIDEFQEFYTINPSVFSDLQKLWDLNKLKAKMQLILMGSVFSLMHRIFESSKEPLFGRASYFIHLKPFTPNEMHNILLQHGRSKINVLFDYYMFTGGVPKYVDILVSNKKYTQSSIIDFIFSPHSPFINEGRNVLIEEFGKEYGVYFSILELISLGKTGRGEIESILQMSTGGYLDRLVNDYSVLRKLNPINAKPNSRTQKYQIKDKFLKFWFRFIYAHRTAVESGNFGYIKQILKRDFSTYQRRLLEDFFHDLFLESYQFNRLGSYWERYGLNEIDFVGVNDLEKKLFIAEIKLNKKKIDMKRLEKKSLKLIQSYPKYEITYQGLTLEDARALLKASD